MKGNGEVVNSKEQRRKSGRFKLKTYLWFFFLLQLTGNHPEYTKLSIQLIGWNKNRQDREVKMFSLRIRAENKRKRYTMSKHSLLVALRESHEEGRRNCCKSCWKSNKEGWWKATRGYCHKSQARKKVIKAIRLGRKVKEDTEIPRVSQKEVIWDLGELVWMGRAGARLQWVRGKEINAVIVNRPFKSLRSETEKGVLGEKEKLTCLHWNFTNKILFISFPFSTYELPFWFVCFVFWSILLFLFWRSEKFPDSLILTIAH